MAFGWNVIYSLALSLHFTFSHKYHGFMVHHFTNPWTTVGRVGYN